MKKTAIGAKALLAAILYLLAAWFGSAAREGLQYTQAVLDTEISGAGAAQIQQQEWEETVPIGFCFWGETQDQLVTCQETGGVAAVTQICMAGNPALLDAGMLAFQEGCLVDRETAQDLFGTAQVGSQILWHKDKAYPVLGILDAPRRTMAMMAEPEAQLDRLVMALSPEQGAVLGPQCLLRWGLQGTVLDGTLLASVIHNLLLLFPVILVTGLCKSLAKGWQNLTLDGILYGQQLGLWARVILAAVIWLGALLYLGSQVEVPKDMIPSRWSDFSFWQRWWESEKKNAVQLLFTPMENGRLQMGLNMVKSVVLNSMACLVLLWPARRSVYADTADRR